jgi:hypothetical protein
MPWTFQVGDQQIRLDTFTGRDFGELAGVGDDTMEIVNGLLVTPLANWQLATRVAKLCARKAGIENPDKYIDDLLDEEPFHEFGKRFQEIEDDLPEMFDEHGVPTEGTTS